MSIQRTEPSRSTSHRRPIALAALALALGATATTAARAAESATLADLIASAGPHGNGTLVQGDKIFSNFSQFTSIGTAGATAPTSAEILATTAVIGGNPGLIFSSAKWNVNPTQTVDTGWVFTVTSTGLSIIDAELGLLSYAADGNSTIHITESLSNGVNLLVEAPGGPFTDHHVFSPVQSLTVAKDVSLVANAGHASLSTLTQSFSQVPEPSTYLAGGLMGLLGLTRWLRCRGQVA